MTFEGTDALVRGQCCVCVCSRLWLDCRVVTQSSRLSANFLSLTVLSCNVGFVFCIVYILFFSYYLPCI